MSNNRAVHVASSTFAFDIGENGLSFVVFGTVAFSLLMSVLFMVTRGTDNLYDHIGQGGLSREGDFPAGAPAPNVESPAGRAEQEQEVRQMLRARSDRLVRRGEPALDIDAEVARLLAPPAGDPRERDAGLLEEVRQLVVARNERRARQGLEPLDVEAEVAQTLRELDP
ncbi:MAG TPA: hypothetical protein VGN13_02325 [Solirubrobacteraceae bacterium]|jgi:hypothetical protein